MRFVYKGITVDVNLDFFVNTVIISFETTEKEVSVLVRIKNIDYYDISSKRLKDFIDRIMSNPKIKEVINSLIGNAKEIKKICDESYMYVKL